MLHIAVVGGDPAELAELADLIREELCDCGQPAPVVDMFSGGAAFLAGWRPGAYDAVVLDIHAGRVNGIETAPPHRGAAGPAPGAAAQHPVHRVLQPCGDRVSGGRSGRRVCQPDAGSDHTGVDRTAAAAPRGIRGPGAGHRGQPVCRGEDVAGGFHPAQRAHHPHCPPPQPGDAGGLRQIPRGAGTARDNRMVRPVRAGRRVYEQGTHRHTGGPLQNFALFLYKYKENGSPTGLPFSYASRVFSFTPPRRSGSPRRWPRPGTRCWWGR